MRAIILAGGRGTRLRPYTTLIPKPLVPIGDKYSILEIIIKQLSNAGFSHITLAVNHLSHLIMAFFGDGSRFGIKIDYSIEEHELSTIGPLTQIKNLPENFLVMNGDILSDLDYKIFYNNHVKMKNLITVSTFKRTVSIDFGVLQYSDKNFLTKFVEKPKYDFSVSMGIYCISREVITQLPSGMRYGFDDLMLDSLNKSIPVAVSPFEGYWLDIGRTEDYQNANDNYEELFSRLNIS